MRIRVEVEEFISHRLRKPYGISKSMDDASQPRNKKNKGNSRKKTSVQSPIVVDTSYASEVDDDSEKTLLSRRGRIITERKQTATQHARNSTEEKRDLNLSLCCTKQSPETR